MMRTSGKGSAKFIEPMRACAKWTPGEIAIIADAVAKGLNLHETCALLPYRTATSVKHPYYAARQTRIEPPTNCRQRAKRSDPAELDDFRFRKDARDGSAALLQAMIRAGLVPAPRKAG